MKTSSYLIISLLLLIAGSLQAQPPVDQDAAPTPDAETLDAEQLRLLEQSEQAWQELSPAQQERVIRNVRRWQSMSPEQRERARERGREFLRHDDERRQHIRNNFENFRNLPESERRAIRDSFRRFQNLSEARRRELIEEYQRRGPQGRPSGSPRERGDGSANPRQDSDE